MLGTRGPQRGLFEADTRYGDFVGRDTFYGWLAHQRGELFPDELFLGLSIDGWGRPSVPPGLLATALVLQTYDGVSDDEATRRVAYDLQWKVALGIELDCKPFAKSPLQEFRAWGRNSSSMRSNGCSSSRAWKPPSGGAHSGSTAA